MELQNEKLYFFTNEIPCKNLPIECRLMRFLKNKYDREVLLIETIEPVEPDNISYYVLEPKHKGTSFATDHLVFAYVLDGSDYVDKEVIDLSRITSGDILNWGGLTNSLEEARKWQIRDEA